MRKEWQISIKRIGRLAGSTDISKQTGENTYGRWEVNDKQSNLCQTYVKCILAYRWTYERVGGQIDRQMDIWKGRRTDRQTGGHMEG